MITKLRKQDNVVVPLTFFVFFLVGFTCNANVDAYRIHSLSKDAIEVEDQLELNIFCRKPDEKTLSNYFRSATLRIISTADDIKVIKGHSDRDVYDQFHSTKWLIWAANILPWRIRETSFPTFNASCVGISTSKPYTAILINRLIDGWNLCTLLAGLGLFFFAPKLSKSTLFFYGSGTCIGALGAALVLLFIVTRVLPKGKGYYFAITALWTLCLYFTGEMWKSIEQLLYQKLPYVLVYLTSGALVALIVCYRYGPPQNPKTLDLIRWALQTGGLCLIHLSSDLTEISTAIIIVTILYYNLSEKVFYYGQKYWRRRFPPKTKLLTEEEYITQGAAETRKELENLKKFCSSPDCNSWKLVCKLKNPRRFSEFIEGSSHLSDAEMMDYETEVVNEGEYDPDTDDALLTDDDEDDDFRVASALPALTSTPQPQVSQRSQKIPNGNGMVLTDDESETD